MVLDEDNQESDCVDITPTNISKINSDKVSLNEDNQEPDCVDITPKNKRKIRSDKVALDEEIDIECQMSTSKRVMKIKIEKEEA